MTINKNIKLAHLTHGSIIGGVERDFSEFIACPYKNKNVTHFVVTTRGFHPYIKNRISLVAQKVYSLSHCCNFKIPKPLRYIKANYIISKLQPMDINIWLLWNIFPSSKLSSFILNFKSIYYEMGNSWETQYFTNTNKIFLEKISCIICCSYATKRMLELKWGITNKNIKVVQNALRPSCKTENPNVKTIDKNRPMILGIAGRHVSYKGFPLVACALAELKRRKIPCQLLVAGVGKKLDDLKKLALKLNIEKEVVFLGLVDDMNTFYSKIDLFICPSIREPFGLVNIEAMAHGCPVIVAGVDGMPEILEGSNAGIVIRPTLEIERYPEFGGSLDFLNKIVSVYDPYTDTIIRPRILNPVHLADAVEDLWSNPDNFSEISKNAVKHVNNKFDYENHVKEVYKIIEDVIK